MEEAEIHFATPTGTNGEKDFYDIMRKMVPSSSGTVLNDSWNNSDVQTITLKAKIPTYIHDKNQLAFVAFIQDNGPKRVHQAAYSQPQSLPVDVATSSISNSALLCDTVIPFSATIKNPASTTLTSCLINYKLDAGTVNTYTWTGSLSQGTSTTVALPSFHSTAGTHTITVYTSMPNGTADINTGNDQQTSSIVLEPLTAAVAPIAEGFTVTTFPPSGWALNNPDHGSYSWKRATTGVAPTASGSAEYQFYSNPADGDIDELYMKTVDFTTISAPHLSFDHAYNYYDDGQGDIIYDSLAVMISTDCGSTWNSLMLDGGPGLTTAATQGDGSSYTPTTSEWQHSDFDLSSYGSDNNVLIKFVTINHYGNNLYVDNVNITAATGIANTQGNINRVNIYPNPAKEQFTVKVNLASGQKTNIAVYNVMGQQVLNQNQAMSIGDNTVMIPAANMEAGMYQVIVTTQQGVYTTKVSVAK